MLKRYAPLMLLAITFFVFFAGLVTNSRASVTQDNDGPVFSYRVLDLFQMKGRDIQPVINDYGRNGWEMVAADENRVFFKKQLR